MVFTSVLNKQHPNNYSKTENVGCSPDCAHVSAIEGDVAMGVHDGLQSEQQVDWNPNITRTKTLKTCVHTILFSCEYEHFSN